MREIDLYKLSALALCLGMLGAAACSSCDDESEKKELDALSKPQSYSCGANTHRVGDQCVGDE